jgi:hypothetical protein
MQAPTPNRRRAAAGPATQESTSSTIWPRIRQTVKGRMPNFVFRITEHAQDQISKDIESTTARQCLVAQHTVSQDVSVVRKK